MASRSSHGQAGHGHHGREGKGSEGTARGADVTMDHGGRRGHRPCRALWWTPGPSLTASNFLMGVKGCFLENPFCS